MPVRYFCDLCNKELFYYCGYNITINGNDYNITINGNDGGYTYAQDYQLVCGDCIDKIHNCIKKIKEEHND